MLVLIMSSSPGQRAKWKTCLSCRSRTAIVGKQVNLGLEISMKDFTTFSSELIHCADINYIRLIQTYFGDKLNRRSSDIITHMSDPNSSDILSDILRPGETQVVKGRA